MFQETFKLHEDEKVLMYVRRHWIFLALEMKGVFLMFLIPAVLVWFVQYQIGVPEVNVFGIGLDSLLDILVYMWGVLCWLFVAEKFTDYALDFWIITNKRIVESELIKLFSRQVSTLELQDIEDITIKNPGFFSNYFNYGTLQVQTAGTEREFFAERVANPEYIQKVIFDAKLLQDKEEKDIEKEEVEQITHRVLREEGLQNHSKDLLVPKDQRQTDEEWIDIDQMQKNDNRNIEEVMEEIGEEYKKNIDSALRVE